ncbi:MAG: hypothetical protein HZB52_11650 [Chloroflexi bacterium]|nr:hypothetical protein [Chloroflexota bacterium]
MPPTLAANNMPSPTLCTIIAKNFLPYARCLTDSFLTHHPDGRVFLLLIDEIEGCFDPAQERFTLVQARELRIPDFEQMTFRYTILELSTALRPFFFAYLFETSPIQTLVYLDADACLYHPLTQLQEVLQTAQIVLTPHLLAPLNDDGRLLNELSILSVGAYNMGFIALARGEETVHFLRWWQQHLLKDCVIDLSRNLFVDQRWIDLVPGLFSGVVILRDAGYNAAHWNISYRRLHRIGDQWHANDVPLVFFHFSSLQPENISVISTHQNRYTLSDLPALRPLFEQYHDALFSNGYATACHWRYTYSRFDNGVPVADDMRYIWRDHDGESRWHQPFNTQGDDSFFNWLNAPAYHVTQTQPLITHLALEMCRRRPDWRDAFPAPLNFSRQAFARHFVREMIRQSILDPAFVTPMRESLESFLQTPFAMLRRRFYDLIRSVLRLKTFKVFKTLKVSSDKSHRD